MSPKIAFPAFFLLFTSAFSITAIAQENSSTDVPTVQAALERAPTSAEIMRDRISKAKAMLAVKNFPAAEYELTSIKKESSDNAVLRVVNVLLMHTFLEQGDYPEAQKLLKETKPSNEPGSAMDYLAVAGQVVSGAREQTERYKSLGLSVNDRNLPTVAIADIEGMRTTLEMVIDQSKVMTADTELRSNAAALLEESSSVRGSLARDAYDAKQWKDTVVDAREQMMGSRSVILSAVTPAAPEPNEAKEAEVGASRISNDKPSVDTAAKSETPKESVTFKPVVPEKKPEPKPLEPQPKKEVVAKQAQPEKKPDSDASLATDRPVRVIKSAERPASSENADNSDQPNVKSTLNGDDVADASGPNVSEDGPLTLGSLVGYATRRVNPVYPRQARSMRLTGVVIVKVLVDEDGTVARVADADGPPMLSQAASDAIRKWKFKPFTRDGQPVKATGFVSFNFNL